MFDWSQNRFMGMILAAVTAYIFIVDWTCRRLASVSAGLRIPRD